MAETGRLRIGELSRRVGESPELLRAWETRYGLVAPERTAGGLRLYSEQDERRVRAMREHINAGLSASEAARLAKLADDPQPEAASATLADIEAALERSFDDLDEAAAQAALDRLLDAFAIREALAEVILPFLRRLGVRWAAAQASVVQEHFASNIIAGRLRGLARGWEKASGHAQSWPVRPESCTSSDYWPSVLPSASAAGGSPTWALTLRWVTSAGRWMSSPPQSSCSPR